MNITYTASMRRTEIQAVALIAALIGGGGLALGLAHLSGAVVAPASVVVENSTRKVQHMDGGIIAEIRVKNGDSVAAGDVILRLDATEAAAGLEIAQSQLDETRARKERLLCESVSCPKMPSIAGDRATDHSAIAMLGQSRLFDARRETRQSKKKQIAQRTEQLRSAHLALTAQLQSTERQSVLTEREAGLVEPLAGQGLVPLNRLINVQRERERLDGEKLRLAAEIQRAAAQITETEIQLLEIDQTNLSEVLAEIRDAETKEAELVEKVTALKSRRDRAVVVAPVGGLVHNLTATTISGVIKAGETIAEIVPQSEELILEAKVDVASIDRLAVGQTAHIRFPSLNQRATPVLDGTVIMVAADANQDQRSGQNFFSVQARLGSGELARLNGQRLRPGMPAEIQFATGDRALWSYLLKPVTDQMSRALLEP